VAERTIVGGYPRGGTSGEQQIAVSSMERSETVVVWSTEEKQRHNRYYVGIVSG
jgi:hypothetical protein